MGAIFRAPKPCWSLAWSEQHLDRDAATLRLMMLCLLEFESKEQRETAGIGVIAMTSDDMAHGTKNEEEAVVFENYPLIMTFLVP